MTTSEASNSKTSEQLESVAIRFAGDSGDGIQLTGTQFSKTSALAGNDIATLPDFLEVTRNNLNDHCVEGLQHKELPIFSIQCHPEASPGPHDSYHLFGYFAELMKRHAA